MMKGWPFNKRREDAEALDPQTAYALWAATYPPYPHNRLMEIEQETVLSLLPAMTGRVVLDAGCGTGRYLREVGNLGARAIGVDASPAMLSRARVISPRVSCADICALPMTSSAVDAVVCALVLGDVPDLERAVRELSRVLRPGGVLVYSVVHPDGARAGWSRTFDANGRRLAINTYWHSAEHHRLACAGAGLRVTAWQEPVLADAPDHPAVLAVRAEK